MDYCFFTPKALIEGKRVGKGKTGLYVAIPDRGYLGKKIYVMYKNRNVLIENWDQAEVKKLAIDKIHRGYYTLGYFKWPEDRSVRGPKQLGLNLDPKM